MTRRRSWRRCATGSGRGACRGRRTRTSTSSFPPRRASTAVPGRDSELTASGKPQRTCVPPISAAYHPQRCGLCCSRVCRALQEPVPTGGDLSDDILGQVRDPRFDVIIASRPRFALRCVHSRRSGLAPHTDIWQAQLVVMLVETPKAQNKTSKLSCRVHPKPNLSRELKWHVPNNTHRCFFFLSSCHQQLPRLEVAEPHVRAV